MRTMFVPFALAGLLASASFAQNASSKATAAINTAVGCTLSTATNIGDTTLPQTCHDIFTGAATEVTADNFATIMTATIKVSNSQSLFVSPSLVTGLYTQTKTKSSPGSGPSTAVAAGGVYLRAIAVDQYGNVIESFPVAVCNPDILGCYTDKNGSRGVTIDSRVQTLTQDISNCIVNDLTGSQIGTCTFDLTTDLILQTTSAHTFNFIFPSIGVGAYTLKIQAAVNADAQITSGTGSAAGASAYGLGSVTVESVRLVHDFSF